MNSGYVYILASKRYLKIGHSQHLDKRLAVHKTQSSKKYGRLHCIGCFAGTTKEEHALAATLGLKPVSRTTEWFEYDEQAVQQIKSIPGLMDISMERVRVRHQIRRARGGMLLSEVLKGWRSSRNLQPEEAARLMEIPLSQLLIVERGDPITGHTLADIILWLTTPRPNGKKRA